MKVYAIKDEVIGFTGAIMTAQNDEQIERMMEAAVNDKGTQMAMWPKDFSAWCIGEMDKTTGQLAEMQPRLICRGNQFVIKEK